MTNNAKHNHHICVTNGWSSAVSGKIRFMLQAKGFKIIIPDQREWLLNKLLLADNTALLSTLVAESAQQLQCLVTELERACKCRKLKLKVEKNP